jgi:hypothetical protein
MESNECESSVCELDLGLCVDRCGAEDQCPVDYECVPYANESVCAPETAGNCDCTLAADSSHETGGLVFLLIATVLGLPRNRRRSK